MTPQLIQSGEIVNTHGIRGEVKINPWADSPEFLTEFDVFYLDGVAYQVEEMRIHKNMVLAKLEGVNDTNAAQMLRGKIVEVDRSAVTLDEGSVFIADLIGLPVIADGDEIGKITDVLTLPGNDVYMVQGKHRYMIPAVREFVEPVNLAQGAVYVHLIEGMQTDEN